jgi:hypothetical protein
MWWNDIGRSITQPRKKPGKRNENFRIRDAVVEVGVAPARNHRRQRRTSRLLKKWNLEAIYMTPGFAAGVEFKRSSSSGACKL